MNFKDLIPFGKKNIEVRREEEHPLITMQREMNRLFDDFNRSWPFGQIAGTDKTFHPRIDVTEDAKSFIVTAELPGMSDRDIDLSLSTDTLTIRGEKKEETEERGRNYHYAERSYGSFSRSIPLPDQVDADKVSASFKKGVLTITMPKTTTAGQAKKIAVRTG